MKPVVSIVVATYRREGELKSALESLANQTYNDFEIVLVDDNGNTEWITKVDIIVKSFREKFPGILLRHIVNSPNQGSAETRNIGIDAAKGEYITFLDDDDLYLPAKIERQLSFMIEGQYDFSITDLDLYNKNDKLVDRRTRNYIKETTKNALLRYNLKYHLTGTDTMMFRKEYLVNIGKFAPIDVGNEFYLMQRAIEGGGKFGYLPGCDVKAYVHTGNGGLSSGDRKIMGENALYEYKQKYFGQLPAKDRRYIRMRHYAVIAYAEIRRRNFICFVFNALKSLFSAPILFIRKFVFGTW